MLDVLADHIPACKWVKAACRRHEMDLQRSRAKGGWAYYFDPAAAERKCKFIELLPHTKGEWAARRERLKLEPWQCFILCVVFGWLDAEGLRRFRIVYVEVPRKNGKSAFSAGIGLAMLAGDKEHGAEIYAGATTEKQAWEVFRPAKLMAQRTPAMLDHYGIEVNASNIHILANESRFEPIIGKPGDGASPSMAIVDEYHEHDTPDLVDTMLTGMGARQQPLLWIITTAGSNVSGPCYDERLTCQKVLDGTIEDDRRFATIYTIDVEDDWTAEASLQKANPNYGVSIRPQFLIDAQRDAIRNARGQNVFKTKHLNVWVQARSAAFNMERWAAGYDPTLRLEEFRGHRAMIGLDLASEVDIAALEVLIEDDDGFVEFGRYYLPEETVSDPKNVHYQAWQHDGQIIVTDGAMIDFARIEEDLLELAEMLDVEIAYDPFQATYLVTRLMEKNLRVVKFPQQVPTMSPAMKRVDALIMDGKLRHRCDEKHPMTWMMSNVTCRVDAKDNIYPRKEREQNKIDGPVALIMAAGRMMAEPQFTSIWDRPELWETEGATVE